MEKKKLLFLIYALLIAVSVLGQEKQSDTIYVWTWKSPFSTLNKFYVIDGTREMRISYSEEAEEKKDTVFFDEIDDETMYKYKANLRTAKIRALPIDKVEADMVFDYFIIGDSIDKITRQLGKKKIYVYGTGYKVPFYDKFTRKNVVFDFRFSEGKLWNISRPSANTLPTNNVWAAFQLIQLKESLEDLEAAINKLKKKHMRKK